MDDSETSERDQLADYGCTEPYRTLEILIVGAVEIDAQFQHPFRKQNIIFVTKGTIYQNVL